MKTIIQLSRFIFSFTFFISNTIFWSIPIILLGIIKKNSPLKLSIKISHLLNMCADLWVYGNNINQGIFLPLKIHTSGHLNLSKNSWYLILSNHRSWVDIVILQRVLLGKVPSLKFFLKKSLIFVPLLGLAWWALDFPFVQRQGSRKHTLKNIQAANKACEMHQHIPSSLVNFAEGTRFSQEKHDKKYNSLMSPKAGGSALTLQKLGHKVTGIIDVTILYPEGHASFYDLLAGNLKHVMIDIRVIPMDQALIGDYTEPFFKEFIKQWIDSVWCKKEYSMQQLMNRFKEFSRV